MIYLGFILFLTSPINEQAFPQTLLILCCGNIGKEVLPGLLFQGINQGRCGTSQRKNGFYLFSVHINPVEIHQFGFHV